jgi:hypothetical protein
MPNDFCPAALMWAGVGTLVTPFRSILWSGFSGPSLLLDALNALGALVGLLAFGSPRRARPEPHLTVSM